MPLCKSPGSEWPKPELSLHILTKINPRRRGGSVGASTAREQGLLNGRKRHRNSSVTNCAQPWTPAAEPPPSPLNIRYIWAHSALLGPWWVRGQNYCLQQEKGHRSISIKQHPFRCYRWAKQPLSWLLSYFFLNPFPPPHQQNWIWGGVFHLEDILHQLHLWTCASRSAKVMEKWVVQLAHFKAISNYRNIFFYLKHLKYSRAFGRILFKSVTHYFPQYMADSAPVTHFTLIHE